MAEFVEIITKDNHKFQAYLAQPKQKVKGGIVIIQEIFGVNKHIKERHLQTPLSVNSRVRFLLTTLVIASTKGKHVSNKARTQAS